MIRRLGRWLAAGVAGIALAGLLATAARADFIVDREATTVYGLVSSLYTLAPSLSTIDIDSFTTTRAYRLGTLTAFARSDGAGAPLSVTGSIYSGGPPGTPGASLVDTAFGTLDVHRNIVVDFGGTLLPAGAYYLTAFVTRQTTADGIWFWGTALTGPEALAWQVGVGAPPAPESEVLGLPRLAAAYTLTGEKVAAAPELPTWALFAGGFTLAGLMSARRRARRIAACITA